jgi:hypothetical protein
MALANRAGLWKSAALVRFFRGVSKMLHEAFFIIVNRIFGYFFATFWGAHLSPKGVVRQFIIK